MRILVCIKRVPATGGRIVLNADEQDIDTRYLGFTISPHEECAVEEAVRLVEANGGSTTVLTLGPAAAEEQLRDALAVGADDAILLETDGSDWDPAATAAAIVEALTAAESADGPYDLVLFGNESADSGGYQIGVRVAVALDRPFVTGAKALAVDGDVIRVQREAAGGRDVFEAPLPAVVSVREGINLPRYPSVPGRLRARKKEIHRSAPAAGPTGLVKLRLHLPAEEGTPVEVLGTGADAAPHVVAMLERIGVLRR